MGKVTQKTTTTKKLTVKKKVKNGQKICSNCGGDGVCQVRTSQKKK